MFEGWVKIHRKIQEWGWYKDGNTFRVFIHLLLNAAIEDGYYMGYEVKRGQVIIGRKALSDQLNLSERQVRTALNHLKSTNEITIKTTNRFSIVTINNFGKYQDKPSDSDQQNDQQSDQQVTSNRPASDQQTTTYKEYKECKNVRIKEEKKNINTTAPTAKKRSEQKADKPTFNFETKSWENITPELKQLWIEAYPACDVDICLRQMAAWLIANPRKKKVNYTRFITNWLTREQDRGGQAKSNKVSQEDDFEAKKARILKMFEEDKKRQEALNARIS